jgi:hypothetical protein
MTQSWPAGVPYKVQMDSWEIVEPYQKPLRTDFEAGNSRRRVLVSDVRAKMNYAWLFTTSEFNTFKTWVKTTLQSGTLSFTMPVWDGVQETTKICNFDEGTYSVSTKGLIVLITTTLEVQDL